MWYWIGAERVRSSGNACCFVVLVRCYFSSCGLCLDSNPEQVRSSALCMVPLVMSTWEGGVLLLACVFKLSPTSRLTCGVSHQWGVWGSVCKVSQFWGRGAQSRSRCSLPPRLCCLWCGRGAIGLLGCPAVKPCHTGIALFSAVLIVVVLMSPAVARFSDRIKCCVWEELVADVPSGIEGHCQHQSVHGEMGTVCCCDLV